MGDKASKFFNYWDEYWGLLLEDGDLRFPSLIYGFENLSEQHRDLSRAVIPNHGSVFGFVQLGAAHLQTPVVCWQAIQGQWFTLPSGCELQLSQNSRIVVVQRKNYQGIRAMGGPIESLGRLRYIDGCSDTLLCAPPLQGDPCLNFLHFPEKIVQTEHTHPSTRAGIVAGGEGYCVVPSGRTALHPGRIFYIPKDGPHYFETESNSNMDIIAYHPDSDWGPTHEEHPMINRTLVDGDKIDNTTSRHAAAETISGNSSEK